MRRYAHDSACLYCARSANRGAIMTHLLEAVTSLGRGAMARRSDQAQPWGRGRSLIASVMIAAAVCASAAPSHAQNRADDNTVRIMTQNMDEGTTFQELLAAQSPGAFVAAVTATYQNIQATRPAERAA